MWVFCMAINDKVSNSSIYSCQYNMEGSDPDGGRGKSQEMRAGVESYKTSN